MKNLYLFLALLLFTPSLHAGDVTFLHYSASNGQKFVYAAPAKRLSTIPKWKAKGEPPLSIGKALSSALQNLKNKHPDSVFEVDEIEIDSSRYNSVAAEKAEERCWFYKLRLKATNQRLKIRVIVLMDGSIVEPVAIKQKK